MNVNSKSDQNHQNETFLWKFIPISEYSLPKIAKTESVKNVLKVFSQSIWRKEKKKEDPMDTIKLCEIPHGIQNLLNPNEDWNNAAKSLRAVLKNWFDDDIKKSKIQFIIGSPFSGIDKILQITANTSDLDMVKPPSYEQIINSDQNWLNSIINYNKKPFVINQLEKFYFRCPEGLEFFRNLIDILLSGNFKCIIGCTSWSWSFLKQVLDLDSLVATPLTLEAFNENKLINFLSLPNKESETNKFEFRQIDNKKLVLTNRLKISTTSDNNSKESSDFIEKLAEKSLGIPGIAKAIWNHSLQYNYDSNKNQNSVITIWLKPWTKIQLPVVQPGLKRKEIIILYMIILHGNLSLDLLDKLLLFSHIDILNSLTHLHDMKLIKNETDSWSINPIAYPNIRSFFESEGYLVSVF